MTTTPSHDLAVAAGRAFDQRSAPGRIPVVMALGAVLLLGGCEAMRTYGPPRELRAGDSAAQAQQALGAPTARRALPEGGTRLEFARGPFGRHTWMVDLDAAGRVTRWFQALDEAAFARVAPGQSADALLLALGRPSHRRSGGWQDGEVWSWRYEAVFCQWFEVSVKDGRVVDAAYTPDPLCDVGGDDHP
jgi:hypothetical protein